MKRLTLLLAFSLISSVVFAQKLKVDEVDEFTGGVKKETSWETLCLNSKDYIHVMAYNYAGHIYLDIKHMPSWGGKKRYSIEEDDKLMLMSDDGTITTLYSLEYTRSSNGGGAIGLTGSDVEGIHPTYPIESDDLEALKNQPLKKIRMYTSIGYIECDIKGGKKELIQKMITLVTE